MPWKIKIHERLKVLLRRIVVGATRKHGCSAGAAAPAPDTHWRGNAADTHPCHFFFLFFFFSLSYSRRFALDCDKLDFGRNGSPLTGLHSSASCGLEREREGRRDKVATSCALTWNYDAESKVESCGVDRFLNRCIGV